PHKGQLRLWLLFTRHTGNSGIGFGCYLPDGAGGFRTSCPRRFESATPLLLRSRSHSLRMPGGVGCYLPNAPALLGQRVRVGYRQETPTPTTARSSSSAAHGCAGYWVADGGVRAFAAGDPASGR